jgi:hypothetical protein
MEMWIASGLNVYDLAVSAMTPGFLDFKDDPSRSIAPLLYIATAGNAD